MALTFTQHKFYLPVVVVVVHVIDQRQSAHITTTVEHYSRSFCRFNCSVIGSLCVANLNTTSMQVNK